MTCIDCGTSFYDRSFKQHTQCISEAEKYQGALYKGKKGNSQQQNKQNQQPQKQNVEEKKVTEETKTEVVISKPKEVKTKKDKKSKSEDEKSKDFSKYVKNETNLYKVLKKIQKDDKIEIKDLLKKFKLIKSDDGSIKISL